MTLATPPVLLLWGWFDEENCRYCGLSAIITDDDRGCPSLAVVAPRSLLVCGSSVEDGGGGGKEGRGWLYEGFDCSSKESAVGFVKVRPISPSVWLSLCNPCCWWLCRPSLPVVVKYSARL